MTDHKRDDRDDALDHHQLPTPHISAEDIMWSELPFIQRQRDPSPTNRCNTIQDTSLTDEENNFLTSFDSLKQSSCHANLSQQDEQLTTHNTTNNTNHSFASKIRALESSTPSANRQTLTKKEMDFLHELAQMPEHLLEQLEQMKDVLEHDPRFETSDLFADTEDLVELGQKQTKRLLPDAAFRRQVWLRREVEDTDNKSWTDSSENPLCSSSFRGLVPNKHASTSSTELMGASSQDLESSNQISLESDATIPTSNGKPRPQKRVPIYKIQQPPLAILSPSHTSNDENIIKP